MAERKCIVVDAKLEIAGVKSSEGMLQGRPIYNLGTNSVIIRGARCKRARC
jgi:hypothetical protein